MAAAAASRGDELLLLQHWSRELLCYASSRSYVEHRRSQRCCGNAMARLRKPETLPGTAIQVSASSASSWAMKEQLTRPGVRGFSGRARRTEGSPRVLPRDASANACKTRSFLARA